MKKKPKKLFAPVFRPVNVEVMGDVGGLNIWQLPLAREIQYDGQTMKIFVSLRGWEIKSNA